MLDQVQLLSQSNLVSALELSPCRSCNPNIGRFISLDTYEGDTSSPQSLHRYSYNTSDPVNYIDPSGHSEQPIQFGIGKAAEKMILKLYELDHDTDFVRSNEKPYSGIGGKELADVINYTQKLLGEIKTPGEAAGGDVQLQGYVNNYNASNTRGGGWGRDKYWSTPKYVVSLAPANPALADYLIQMIGNKNGVFVYQYFRKGQPTPVPIPVRYQVPVEVTERISKDIYDLPYAVPTDLVLGQLAAAQVFTEVDALVTFAIVAIAAYIELGSTTTAVASLA